MYRSLIIIGIFLLSCITTLLLIMRRPFLYIRMGARKIKLDTYFFGTMLGPLFILVFGLLSVDEIRSGLEGSKNLNPFGILVLFLSMVFMSIFLDITGFFEFCARIALKYAKTDGKRLFFSLYITVSLLTIFTSNDIIILTFTPFIFYFTKSAGIDPKPYLIGEFFAANTWSMMLYIGNPTNIVLAAAFNMKFLEYTAWMFLPTIAAGTVNALLLYRIFKSKIDVPLKPTKDVRPSDAITDKAGAVYGLLILVLCIIFLALGPYLGIPMWIIAMAFGLCLLIILIIRDSAMKLLRAALKKKISEHGESVLGNALVRMPWTVVPFVLSLFITVQALKFYGVADALGGWFNRVCGSSSVRYIFIYGISSTLAANVLNNIPMTVGFAAVLSNTPNEYLLPASLATVIGSNLGANLTPIGALAGIMWMSILKSKDVDLSFTEFIKYGLMVTPLSLLSCIGILALEFLIF
ncbi:MAG: ArsB/NhaD family transporter [Thermoplasmata archaeon]